MTTAAPRRDRWSALAPALLFLSGFAGLCYEIVWTQQCTTWLGHESAAVLAVVGAFFAGIAAGALAFGHAIERSVRPGRWVAACEAVIGVWGLALSQLVGPYGDAMLRLTGVNAGPFTQWTVAFAGTFVLLLPATAAMGATLPAMERVVRRPGSTGRTVAACYAANTLGATFGVLAAAFWLVPAYGLARTAMLCAGLNATCAVAAIAWLADGRDAMTTTTTTATRAAHAFRPLALLWFTGLLGIGYEVLVVRVLSELDEDTVYTFALLLAVYLVGTATGAAIHARRVRDGGRTTTDGCIAVVTCACLMGTTALWGAEHVQAFLRSQLGPGAFGALAAEAALAVMAFGLPTVAMGALFSHLSTAVVSAGRSFGQALGVNTLGAAAAPVAFGVVALPAIGAKAALLVVVTGYLALATPRAWRRPTVLVPAALTALVAIATPPLAFVDVPDGGHVVRYAEGALAAVSVVEDADGVARLRIDNRQQEGSSASRFVDGRQALLPLLLHPHPRRALFLGLGTGVTAASAAAEAGLDVDAVELLPEVVAASTAFTDAFDDEGVARRLHRIAADARRYVRATDARYDVVVSDNFHPARSGSAALYTVEHFRAVREVLRDDGLFCQWLPLHQLDLATLRSIVRSFVAVFPDGGAMLASNSLETPVIGLVGRRDGRRFDVHAIERRIATIGYPRSLDDFGIGDPLVVPGSFVAGPAALRRFAGDATANTDDHPVVAYRAPWTTYAPGSQPGDRLVELLSELSIRPDELLDAGDTTCAARIAAYRAARDRFIDVGRTVRPSADVDAMLAQVRQPLLAVLRISPEFAPASEPLRRMAASLALEDPGAAERLLAELAATRATRP